MIKRNPIESTYLRKDGHKIAPTQSVLFYKLKVKYINGSVGKGVVTQEAIAKGSIIARDGGIVLSSIKDLPKDKQYPVLIDKKLYLAPVNYQKLETFCFLNHSCKANIARIGGFVFVAKRDIKKGEELTIDYASLIAGLKAWTMVCQCTAKNCRKLITGNDWKDPTLAKKLWLEWLPFIQKDILRKHPKNKKK